MAEKKRTMTEVRDQLNNPLVFIILAAVGVRSVSLIAEWWAKAMHHSGLSTFFGGRIA